MKTLFKSIGCLCFFALWSFGMTSCQKEDEKITLKMETEHCFGGQKAYVNTDRYVFLNEGDQLMVNSQTVSASNVNGINAELDVNPAEEYRVVYPAGIVSGSAIAGNSVNIELPITQVYKEKNGQQQIELPMAGYLEGSRSKLLLRNLASVMRITVPANTVPVTVYSILVKASDAKLSGNGNIGDITSTAPQITMSTADGQAFNSVALDFGSGVTIPVSSSKTFDVVIPAISNTDNKFSIEISVKEGAMFKVYKHSQQNIGKGSIARNQLGKVTFALTDSDPIHHLPGLFTISADTRVYFSSGLLMKNFSDNPTYKFQSSQYTYQSLNENKQNAAATGWGELFPYEDVSNISVQNPMNGNNPDPAGSWRLLDDAEWNYLLNQRSASTINGYPNVRWGKANVEGYYGIVLFPDVFVLPEGCSFTDNINEYTSEKWTAMENAGAVFLPTPGWGVNVNDFQAENFIGNYWSRSTENGDGFHAVGINFLGNFGGSCDLNTWPVNYYFSYRLVHEAE